jgi:hypothetical protein
MEMTTPKKKEPASIYDFFDWRKKPKNPDGLKGNPLKFYFEEGDEIKTIAPKYHITWQQLTRYNWGTDKEREINWYLYEHCGCRELTSTGNYYFTPSPLKRVRIKNHEYIWVPEPKPTVRAPVTRRNQCTIDTPVCPDNDNGKCKLNANLSGQQEACIPPHTRMRLYPSVKLGSRGEAVYRIKEIQNSQLAYIHLNQHLVYRLKPHLLGKQYQLLLDPRNYSQDTDELVSVLMIEFPQKEKTIENIEPVSPKARSIIKKTVPSKIIWTGNEPVTKPAELDEAVNKLRILQEAGWLGRVVVRGHAEQLETADPIEGRKLGKRRAQWIADHLIHRCRLNLVQEPEISPRTLQKEIDLFNENVDSGLIPVCAIGCGEYYAPWDCKPHKEWRRVTIEVEEKKGSPAKRPQKKKTAEQAPEQHLWYVYQTLKKDGSLDKTILYAYGNEHNGLAKGPNTVALFRSEALGYVRLCGEIAHLTRGDSEKLSEKTSKALNYIQNWILGWQYHLVPNIPTLTDAYTFLGQNNKLDHKFQIIPSGCELPWIEHIPVSAKPNWIDHKREGFYTSCSMAIDELTHKNLKRQAHAEVGLNPMWAHFHKGEPKS